jgi:hypothetical protein
VVHGYPWTTDFPHFGCTMKDLEIADWFVDPPPMTSWALDSLPCRGNNAQVIRPGQGHTGRRIESGVNTIL